MKKTPEEQKVTLYEEDLYADETPKEKTVQLIVFRLSNEWYGIDISNVREVIKLDTITYLPSAPENVAGIVNIRGGILSVTDLKKSFGMPQDKLTPQSRLVIIKSGTKETGLLVSEVSEVIDVPVSKIDPVLATIVQEKTEYLEGEYKIGDKLIGILKGKEVLEKR